ncbi:MAG TPA: rhomboid family intramembrane serine protease [Ferruginibacter sp.]|nr:rhomboid family intramembrane serine protease [Ferruginibacter sp.]
MGESDRYIDYKIKKQRFTLGQPDNALVWLFVFNVIFFLILLFIKVAIDVNDNSSNVFYSQVLNWFQLPAGITKFANRPWTIFTFMFSEVEVFRAVSNMLWLWAFGSIFQNLTGNKKLFPVYLYGGVAAGLVFMVASYILPSNKTAIDTTALLGANASIMAIAAATTLIAPGYRLLRHIRNGVPLWVLTAVYFAVDLVSVADKPGAIAIAHIAGALAGFLFVLLLQKKIDGSVWMNKFYYWFMNLFNPYKNKTGNKIKEKVFYNTGNRNPYKKTSNVTEQRINEILDKISQNGMDQLTKEEKDILKRASED